MGAVNVRIQALAWLNRSDIGQRTENVLKRQLTLIRKIYHPNPRFRREEETHHYELTRTELGVPREFYLGYRLSNHLVRMGTSGDTTFPAPLKFRGTLRDYQEPAVNAILSKIMTFGSGPPRRMGGILVAGTGLGKTIMTLAVIAALQVPTLVVLNRQFMIDQWQEETETFLPDAVTGVIQGKKCQIEGRHIVFGMIQSLSRREYAREVYEWPGLVAFDETHHIGAKEWTKVVKRFPSRYRLGLSATPERKDGLTDVFFWHIGGLLYSVPQPLLKPVLKRVWTKYQPNDPDLPESVIIKNMMRNQRRNNMIIDQLIRALDADRHILLLTTRRWHAEHLHEMYLNRRLLLKAVQAVVDGELRGAFEEPDALLERVRTGDRDAIEELNKAAIAAGIAPESSVVLISTPKKSKRKADMLLAKTARVLFATEQYVKEAFNVPRLDTALLALPMGDIRQSVGRILRKKEGKKRPIVVDFRDDFVDDFREKGERREQICKQLAA